MTTDFNLASARIPLLSSGQHAPDGQGCALKYLSVARGIPWTDDPQQVRCFDFRAINDIQVSDEVRTQWMLPLIRLYDGSLDWPIARQLAVAKRIVALTIQRLRPVSPTFMDHAMWAAVAGVVVEVELVAEDAAEAVGARAKEWAELAEVVAAAAARASAWASAASALMASAAAGPARVEQVFIRACQIWIEAASVHADQVAHE